MSENNSNGTQNPTATPATSGGINFFGAVTFQQSSITSGETVAGVTINNTSHAVPPAPTGPNEPGPGNPVEPPNLPDPTPTTEKGKNIARILLGPKRMEVYLKRLMPALYRLTEYSDNLAVELEANGVITTFQVEECKLTKSSFDKNTLLYGTIWRKNYVELFIVSLEDSNNHNVIGVIEKFLTTGEIPKFQ